MRPKLVPALFLMLILFLPLFFSHVHPTNARQSVGYFSPISGPPGTTVAVDCSFEGTAVGPLAYYRILGFSTASLIPIPLNRSGQGSFDIPDDTEAGTEIEIICYTNSGDEFGSTLGNFIVTDCMLGNSNYFTTIAPTLLVRSQNAGNTFTGADLGLDASGLFARTLDVSNAFGENLRITVRSANSAQLLDYLNTIEVDFKVDLVNSSTQLDASNCSNFVGEWSDPQPDSSVFMGDVDVELTLLESSFVTAGSDYVVSYVIDPTVANNILHTYRPRRTTAASAQITAQAGRVKLTMWNDLEYINAIVLGLNLPKLPALSDSVNPNQATYYSVVRGMDSTNRYTMRGSFGTTPCNPEVTDCGEVILPQLVLAQGGIGMTTGATMNDGNFQVEAYCEDGYIQGFSGVSNDNNNWFCTQGNQRYQLTQADFTAICQITYDDNDAIAISDKGQSIPAFNWRCFIRQ